MEYLTRFERIPDLFVQVYDAKFVEWARDFKKIGAKAKFIFSRPVEPSPLAIDQRRIVGAILSAEVDRSDAATTTVIIRPLDDAAEDAIRRHVADLKRELVH